MEVQGARKLLHDIEYLSVHCNYQSNILQLVLSSSLEARKFPVCWFLQTAKTIWNSLWESWLAEFDWRPVLGTWAAIQHDTHHDRACSESLQFEMLVQGGKRGQPRSQGICLVVWVHTLAMEYILIWTGEKLCCIQIYVNSISFLPIP